MTNFKISLVAGLSTAILLASGAATVVRANEVAADNLSADQIFEKTQMNYARLASYSDTGQIVSIMNDTAITTTFTTRLARTNFYRIEWQQEAETPFATNHIPIRAVWSSGAGNLLAQENGPQNEGSREAALAKATGVSAGAAGTIPRTFFNMQWGDPLNGSGLAQDQQTDAKVGDVDCYVFSNESPGGTKTLWIGKQDFLIHQIRTVIAAESMQGMMVKISKGNFEMTSDIHGYTSTETHTHIVLNPQFSRTDFMPSNGQ